MKHFWKLYGTLTVLTIILCFLLSFSLKNAAKVLRSNYEKPDTAVTCKAGRCDTTIVKRNAPSWLK